MAWVELERVNLMFPRPVGGRGRFRDWVVHPFRLPADEPSQSVHAIRDVTLHVEEGQRLGIIGSNGAGKSSLLKILAGVYAPTTGHRRVEGRISSLFELLVGFDPDSTGRENIYFRGYLQGETPRSLSRIAGQIADFAELGRFLDMPVRCYSSGMLVRLAFAIATAVDPEVLLIDEFLSAGDLDFQVKARQRIDELIAKARLMVIVSHDLDSIRRLCSRVVWLRQGSIFADGRPEDVISSFESVAATPLLAAA